MTASAAARALLAAGHIQLEAPAIPSRNRPWKCAVELNVLVSMMSAPASKILAMDLLDDFGPGQIEQIVVALDIARPILEPLAAISRFIQAIALDHGAHGAVENDNALPQQAQQRLRPVRGLSIFLVHNETTINQPRGSLQVLNQYILI